MNANMPDVNQVIDAVKGRGLPATANMLSLAAIAFGVVGLGYGFGVAGAAWTYGAILVAIVYVLGVAQGGVMFGVIQTGTRGYWGRPMKRIGEALGVFLFPAWIALIIFLFAGGTTIYVWNPETIIAGGPVSLEPHSAAAISAKPFWLSEGFFIVRLIAAVGFLMSLSLVYIRGSLRPDLIMAKARLGADSPKWWDMVIGGETNLETAVEAGQSTQDKLFVPSPGPTPSSSASSPSTSSCPSTPGGSRTCSAAGSLSARFGSASRPWALWPCSVATGWVSRASLPT